MKIKFKEEHDFSIDLWKAEHSELIQTITQKIVEPYLAQERTISHASRIDALRKHFTDTSDISAELLLCLVTMEPAETVPLVSKIGELAVKLRTDDSNGDRVNSCITAGELLIMACTHNMAKLSKTLRDTMMIQSSYSDKSIIIKYLSALPNNKPTTKHRPLGRYKWQITEREAIDKLNNIAFTLLPFNEDEPQGDDREAKVKYLIRKNVCTELIGKRFYFNWHPDYRGRMYSGGYYINPQGTQFEKSMLALADGEKLNHAGIVALKYAIANAYGLSKRSYDEKLEWFEENQNQLELLISTADEPHTFRRLIEHGWFNYLNDLPVNITIGVDASNSQLQMISVLFKDRQTASICNVVNDSDTPQDAYLLVAQEMTRLFKLSNKHIEFTREHIKKSSMIDGYGAGKELVTAQLKEDMGTLYTDDAVDIFYQAQMNVAPAAAMAKQLFQSLWNNTATEITWTMPDGFKCQLKPISTREIDIPLFDMITLKMVIQLNLPTNRNTPLGVSVIHSTDGYVARQMIQRCDFTLFTIHDDFNCHPNYVFKAQNQYKRILADINESNMLIDIMHDILGKPRVQSAPAHGSLKSSDILMSQYAIA